MACHVFTQTLRKGGSQQDGQKEMEIHSLQEQLAVLKEITVGGVVIILRLHHFSLPLLICVYDFTQTWKSLHSGGQTLIYTLYPSEFQHLSKAICLCASLLKCCVWILFWTCALWRLFLFFLFCLCRREITKATKDKCPKKKITKLIKRSKKLPKQV